jgi:hypothetical protein
MPSSQYIIKIGVDFFKFSINLQNFKCTLSIISMLPSPHISHPYNRIGFTILSKRSYWDLIDKLCNLPFFNTSYITLYALLIKTFFAFVKLPVLEKFRPRYVNSYKKLIFWGNRPLENIIILDLLELTSKHIPRLLLLII